MDELRCRREDGILTLTLSGIINSASARGMEAVLSAELDRGLPREAVLDCGELEYISSAGIRLILRVRKAVERTRLVNVNTTIYDILDTTGLTEMLEVEKALRTVSVAGCPVVGSGGNGRVLRLDGETVVKVYDDPDALPQIRRERELARTAFILGLPTAIPYDVVRIREGGYGSVFELLEARSLAWLIQAGEKTPEEAAAMSIRLLKQIHGTLARPGSVPDMRATALGWADFLRPHLPPEQGEKLRALLAALPEDGHLLHGDFHAKNVMVQAGECLLIDMDTLSCGHPVFELASMFNAYCGFSDLDASRSRAFMGFERELGIRLWRESLALYLGTREEGAIRAAEERAQLLGYTRILRRGIRRGGLETPSGRREIENCKRHLGELLPGVDSLAF